MLHIMQHPQLEQQLSQRRKTDSKESVFIVAKGHRAKDCRTRPHYNSQRTPQDHSSPVGNQIVRFGLAYTVKGRWHDFCSAGPVGPPAVTW